MAILKFKRD